MSMGREGSAVPGSSRTESSAWGAFQMWIGILGGALALSVISQVIVSSTHGRLRERAVGVQAAWPQEWSFFSRYRDAPIIYPYRFAGGAAPVDLVARAESADDAGGLRKKWMSQLIERSYLAAAVPAQAWSLCRSPGQECVRTASTQQKFAVRNSATRRTLCGDMILLRTPSADREFRPEVELPFVPAGAVEAARVEVTCES
ncbi:hypothetical protein [Krasilnikovia sp. MM14-A1259]|uniref:hypothetical protein n=1 Tax=Krasilnikovia sp. MM14-A1259 TaxID=3373539 RepID=UPI0038308C53